MSYEDEIERYSLRNSHGMTAEETWRWQIRRTMERDEARRAARREASQRWYQRRKARRARMDALRAMVTA